MIELIPRRERGDEEGVMPGPLLIGPLGPLELAIIVGVIVLLFGVGRISRIGGDLGSSIKEFRRAVREDDEGEEEGATEEVQAQVQPEQAAPQQPVQQAAPPAQQAAPPAAAPPADSAPQGDSTTRNVF